MIINAVMIINDEFYVNRLVSYFSLMYYIFNFARLSLLYLISIKYLPVPGDQSFTHCLRNKIFVYPFLMQGCIKRATVY